MSINHYSSEIPEALWWTQQHQTILMEPMQDHVSSTSPPPPNSQPHHHCHHLMYPTTHSNFSHRFNLNQNEDDDNENAQSTTTAVGAVEEEEKEAMFEKPLTPSDVGKLNRLVIPKQHAEKYFPLGADSGESKGLLLSFEDESGKCWRFRYSYWNSSQSYVLTKGWSRYVKEKRLDAGDVVLFERHPGDAQRFFIGWRRRRRSGSAAAPVSNSRAAVGESNSNNNGINMGVGWTSDFYSAHAYPTHHHQPLPYQPHCLHAGIRGAQEVENETTSRIGNSSRTLRLFGVNMECQPEHESGPSRPECSYLSSTQGTAAHHHHDQLYTHQPSYSPSSYNHMEP